MTEGGEMSYLYGTYEDIEALRKQYEELERVGLIMSTIGALDGWAYYGPLIHGQRDLFYPPRKEATKPTLTLIKGGKAE